MRADALRSDHPRESRFGARVSRALVRRPRSVPSSRRLAPAAGRAADESRTPGIGVRLPADLRECCIRWPSRDSLSQPNQLLHLIECRGCGQTSSLRTVFEYCIKSFRLSRQIEVPLPNWLSVDATRSATARFKT